MSTPEPDLFAVAEQWMLAVHEGRGPSAALVERVGVHRSTVTRHVWAARAAGLLPPGKQGAACPDSDGHWPRMAAFNSGVGRWLACVECHLPWPCPDASTLTWIERIRTRRQETQQ